MNEELPQEPPRKKASESHLFNMSARGIITMIVVVTVCAMSFQEKEINEPLYTLVGMVIGYYFGQRKEPAKQTL